MRRIIFCIMMLLMYFTVLEGVNDVYKGKVVLGEDGMIFTLAGTAGVRE